MHDLLERAGGDIATALAAYNAGPAVMPADWPRETRAYVARILRRFGGPAELSPLTLQTLLDAGAAPAGRPNGGEAVAVGHSTMLVSKRT